MVKVLIELTKNRKPMTVKALLLTLVAMVLTDMSTTTGLTIETTIYMVVVAVVEPLTVLTVVTVLIVA